MYTGRNEGDSFFRSAASTKKKESLRGRRERESESLRHKGGEKERARVQAEEEKSSGTRRQLAGALGWIILATLHKNSHKSPESRPPPLDCWEELLRSLTGRVSSFARAPCPPSDLYRARIPSVVSTQSNFRYPPSARTRVELADYKLTRPKVKTPRSLSPGFFFSISPLIDNDSMARLQIRTIFTRFYALCAVDALTSCGCIKLLLESFF